MTKALTTHQEVLHREPSEKERQQS